MRHTELCQEWGLYKNLLNEWVKKWNNKNKRERGVNLRWGTLPPKDSGLEDEGQGVRRKAQGGWAGAFAWRLQEASPTWKPVGLAAISSQSFFPPFSGFSCHNLFLEDSNVTWQNEVSAWSFRENNLIFNSPWTLCSPVMPTSQPLRCPLVPGSEEEKKGKAQGQLCFLKRSIASLK